MYDCLIEEMARIKTPKFHRVDGPAYPALREAVGRSVFPLPPSYKEFVLRFGNAKLYRRIDYYLVEVYAGPREVTGDKGEALIHFGRTHTCLAYFKESLLVSGSESPVFEWRHRQGLRETSSGFLDWLKAKCAWARRQYKKKEWEAIEKGPPPFSPHELAIVEARRRFRWRVVGIAPNSDLQFEIHNGSETTLPFLSIGIRGKLRSPNEGPLTGGAYLDVSAIAPGETEIIEHDCYKKHVAPEDVEAFGLPDPGPEDRELYWELRFRASR